MTLLVVKYLNITQIMSPRDVKILRSNYLETVPLIVWKML